MTSKMNSKMTSKMKEAQLLCQEEFYEPLRKQQSGHVNYYNSSLVPVTRSPEGVQMPDGQRRGGPLDGQKAEAERSWVRKDSRVWSGAQGVISSAEGDNLLISQTQPGEYSVQPKTAGSLDDYSELPELHWCDRRWSGREPCFLPELACVSLLPGLSTRHHGHGPAPPHRGGPSCCQLP